MTLTGYFEMKDEEQKRHIKKIACGADSDDSSCTVRSFFFSFFQKRLTIRLQSKMVLKMGGSDKILKSLLFSLPISRLFRDRLFWKNEKKSPLLRVNFE